MTLEWWEIEPVSCDAALLAAHNFRPTAVADVVERLKPGANVVLTGTLDGKAVASATASLEDAGLEVRDCGCVLEPNGMSAILLARKPLDGTAAANVLKYGTGALNIDACRIGMSDEDAEFIRKTARPNSSGDVHVGAVMNRPATVSGANVHDAGRWPANLLLEHAEGCQRTGVSAEVTGGGAAGTSGFADGYQRGDGYDGRVVASESWLCVEGCPAKTVDRQSGISTSQGGRVGKKQQAAVANVPAGEFHAGNPGFGDTGGASRFFRADNSVEGRREYLIRLVIQRGGTLLDLSGEVSTEYCKVLQPV